LPQRPIRGSARSRDRGRCRGASVLR
jgi:hypothetical protein